MKNQKLMKNALFSSLLALVLCFTLLVGTTFAWFTNAPTSENNVITAGKLDVDVTYTLDGTTWNSLNGADDLFQIDKWEPGHTETVVLSVANKGSLALKYSANMNLVSETAGKNTDGDSITLSDLLTVSTCTQPHTDANGNEAEGASSFLSAVFAENGQVDYQDASAFSATNVLSSTPPPSAKRIELRCRKG